MDIWSKEKRSAVMSRIRGKNTKPELIVRSMLHKMGYRFRLHSRKLPGNPDIVLPKYKTAIFVHGCFWHRHKGCKYSYMPKTRKKFWHEKFKINIARDKRVSEELKVLRWKQVVVWECDIQRIDRLRKKLLSTLK